MLLPATGLLYAAGKLGNFYKHFLAVLVRSFQYNKTTI